MALNERPWRFARLRCGPLLAGDGMSKDERVAFIVVLNAAGRPTAFAGAILGVGVVLPI
jgi:hypothetical protein